MAQKANENNKLNGIKLKTITILLVVFLLVLCGLFTFNVIRIRNGYNTLAATYEENVRYRNDAQMVIEGSFYLTEQVHLYVVTGDKQYADNYFKEVNDTRRRTNAVEDLRRNAIITSAQHHLIEALEQSEKLKELEVYAIRLVAEAIAEEEGLDEEQFLSTFDKAVSNSLLITSADHGLSPDEKRKQAINIVFDEHYLDFRDGIDSSIQEFIITTYAISEKDKDAALASMKISIIMQSVFVALVLLFTVSYIVCIRRLVLKPLGSHLKSVRESRTFEVVGVYEFKHFALTYNNNFEMQHENEKMLRQNAERDTLTGLLNRGAYNRICAKYVDRAINVAALIIDIDDFKDVNDTYGHGVGDDVIRSVGQMLLHNFRPSDIVARVGGDEFVVIMLDITIESKDNIATKIVNFNDTLHNPTSALPATSISVGVAFSEHGFSEELIKRADVALYRTKENGKSGVSFNDDVILKPESFGGVISEEKDNSIADTAEEHTGTLTLDNIGNFDNTDSTDIIGE